MERHNAKYTPAEKDPLSKDAEDDPCCEEWNKVLVAGRYFIYLEVPGQT